MEVTQGFNVPTDSQGGASQQAVYPSALPWTAWGRLWKGVLPVLAVSPKSSSFPQAGKPGPSSVLTILSLPPPSSQFLLIPFSCLLPSPLSLYPSSLQIKGLKIKTQFWWLVWGLLEAT